MTLLISFSQVSIRPDGGTTDKSVCTIYTEKTGLECLITKSNFPDISRNTVYFVTVIAKNTFFQKEVIKNITTQIAGM